MTPGIETVLTPATLLLIFAMISIVAIVGIALGVRLRAHPLQGIQVNPVKTTEEQGQGSHSESP